MQLIINNQFVIPLLEHQLQEINKIHIREEHLQPQERQNLLTILEKYQDLFQPPDEKLSFTTQVRAEIKTTDDNPIYSKTYPYPQALKDEVKKQINKLLEDGIIRPSKSPYNSPIWIVPKKVDASKVDARHKDSPIFRKLQFKQYYKREHE